MKVVLLNDTDGRENIGCRLTSSALKEQLRSALGAHATSLELMPFPWHFGRGSKTKRVWMSGLALLVSGNTPNSEERFAAWLSKLAQQEYGQEATEKALNADLVIFHPEGSISNNHDATRIINLLSLPLLACWNRIPTFTINGTFPLYSETDRRYQIIHHFLEVCHFVALRDRLTAEHYGVNFMPDAAIMHRLSSSLPSDQTRPYLLITTGASLSKRANIAMAQNAIRFAEAHQLKPLVLTKKHRDLKGLKSTITAKGGAFIEQASLAEAEQWLAQCALHIGGRYHMALFGLLLGVPSVLMLTNTHKNQWLAEDFSGIALTDATENIGRTASKQFPFDKTQQAEMRESVHKAQEIFTHGMEQACRIAGQNLQTDTGQGQTEVACCQNVRKQLRFYDFIPI